MAFGIKSNPRTRTLGVSPKVGYPALALAALGVVLCVLDQVGVIDVDDELWIGLIGASGITGVLGFSSPPALQESSTPVSATAATTVPDPGKPSW